ncbi:hypothetical protein FACS1894170_04500 [Planctomycetales bacterium]|nr:hypothetical protein FACS1894170_04500 [Planctomycetales bacterium]
MIRIYSDTSVISCIDAPDTPERERTTHRFFQLINDNPDEYELVISPVVMRELMATMEPKRLKLITFLETLTHTLLSDNPEAERLASSYISSGILSETHKEDLQHIAYSVVAACNYVVSWNMKHFVRERTISGVNAVNVKLGYSSAFITTPILFTGELSDVRNG